MTDTLYRYPGAQPFRDDDFSRRTFFGREQASIALADQILANRLVVVYAKSGLGKTSLLNAGVAPRLREADSVPLFVRVNDIQRGPLTSVIEGIRADAERQQVEYVPGDSRSLWSFFKSVEFWRGDLLLAPVLILDQFEELFTLQSEETRESFLSELGYLVRGVPPPSLPQSDPDVSHAPPSVRVVLSLREDFLGLLEEAADRIPQIMDHRFRLAPLNCETAAKAITGPAAIDDPKIASKPFRLEPELVTSILDYLTKSTTGGRSFESRYVEPFHLQLICQRIERIAASKQQVSSQEVVLSFKDLGGEAALAQTLESFYKDAIQSLPDRHLRGAARLLCEQFLISPEGRRLSVEERELQRQLKLPHDTLSQLVERRLLRTDRRSDSTYYELSHDALVQPVLASRRMQALVVGWVAVLGGSIVSLAAGILILLFIYTVVSDRKSGSFEYFLLSFLIVCLLSVGALGIVWLRAGIRRRKRYRRHTTSDLSQPLPRLLPLKDRVLGWVMLVAGSTISALWGLAAAFVLIIIVSLTFTHGRFPHWLAWAKDQELLDSWQELHDHPFREVLWLVVEVSTILGLGWMSLRQGARKLWPHRFSGRSKVSLTPGLHQPSLVSAVLKLLAGVVALVVATLGSFTLRQCVSISHGRVPSWLPSSLVGSDLSDGCWSLYNKGWDGDSVTLALFFFSAFVFAIVLLRSGVLGVSSVLRHRRLTPLEWAKVAAATCGILIIASGLIWPWSRSHPREQPGQAQNEQAATSTSQSDSPPLAWAVGQGGIILHTEDGGGSWKPQSSGTSAELNHVAFATPESGWVVGDGGTILHTEDGGGTWAIQTGGTRVDLSVAAFATPQSGWAVGDGGTILHTDDGGSWKPQSSGTDHYLVGVAFATAQSGWVVGSGGTILHTEDGGGSWKPQTSGSSEHLYFVASATPQSVWAVGAKGTILHTEDGGATWNQQTSGASQDLFGLAFVTPLSGWAVGHGGTILHTEDGGRTWNTQTSRTRADLIEVTFATPQSGWAVGDRGTTLHTDDGGNTWTPQRCGTLVGLRSIVFARPRGSIGVEFNAPNAPGARVHAVSSGVTLTNVIPDGPADKAGLRTGDTIVSVNDKPVNTGDELVAEIYALKPGTNARLGYIRHGKDITVNVTIADRSKLIARSASR